MPIIRTRIWVKGFTEAEVREGLDYMLNEFRERRWLLKSAASWNRSRKRLEVTIEREGDDPEECGRATFDEVWDCVIASMSFTSSGIRFHMEESIVVRDG